MTDKRCIWRPCVATWRGRDASSHDPGARPMTDQLTELAAAATPRPWTQDEVYVLRPDGEVVAVIDESDDAPADAALIVYAVNHIEALTAENQQLTAAISDGVRLAFKVNGAVLDEDSVPDEQVSATLRRDRMAARALIQAALGVEAAEARAALGGGE